MPGAVVWTCLSSAQEAEAVGSKIQGQPGLHSQTSERNWGAWRLPFAPSHLVVNTGALTASPEYKELFFFFNVKWDGPCIVWRNLAGADSSP